MEIYSLRLLTRKWSQSAYSNSFHEEMEREDDELHVLCVLITIHHARTSHTVLICCMNESCTASHIDICSAFHHHATIWSIRSPPDMPQTFLGLAKTLDLEELITIRVVFCFFLFLNGSVFIDRKIQNVFHIAIFPDYWMDCRDSPTVFFFFLLNKRWAHVLIS